MSTYKFFVVSLEIVFAVFGMYIFFRSRYWNKIKSKVRKRLDKRYINNLSLNRKKAQEYFQRIVEPYFDSAVRNETHPTFEVNFEGFAMAIYRVATIDGAEDRIRFYHFTNQGQTIYCKTSRREMTLPEFELFIDGILKNHSVVPRK